jgi:hypothetical protein
LNYSNPKAMIKGTRMALETTRYRSTRTSSTKTRELSIYLASEILLLVTINRIKYSNQLFNFDFIIFEF